MDGKTPLLLVAISLDIKTNQVIQQPPSR